MFIIVYLIFIYFVAVYMLCIYLFYIFSILEDAWLHMYITLLQMF